MHSTGMSCVCGTTHRDIAVTPESPAPSAHAVASLPLSTDVLHTDASGSQGHRAFHAPPDPSPGGIFILRI